MSFSMRLSEQAEVAGSVTVNVEWARRPQYGRYLDEFVPGQVFVHPRGYLSLIHISEPTRPY